MSQTASTTRATRQWPRWRTGRIVSWVVAGLAAAALITSIAIPVVSIQLYLEQSTSMQPTLAPGDRLFAVSGAGARRGDLIVFHVPRRVSRSGDLFVKRLIGLPGDHVACCDARGQVTVNGKPLDESYLYPGDRPSLIRFSVTLGSGQVWVMGDHRNISVDSRQWGAIPASGIVSRIVFVARGSSLSAVRTPRAFVAAGLAPADSRPGSYLRLALLAAASLAVLIAVGVASIAAAVLRKRRARRQPPVPAAM